MLSFTSWDISSMASRDGNGDPGVGNSCSDPRRESYAFLALRTWDRRDWESAPMLESSNVLEVCYYRC